MSNEINKVIILVETTFNGRDYKRFGVDILLKNGFDVHVIDFCALLHLKFYETIEIYDIVEYANYRCVKNISDVTSELNKFTRNSFIINFLQFNLNTYKVYRLISKYTIPYAVLGWPPVLFYEYLKNENISVLDNIRRKIRNFRLSKIQHYLLAYLPISLLGLKPARYVFCSTLKSDIRIKVVDKSTEIVMIHAFDYDNYLDSLKMVVEYTNTIVFLDQNLPLHSDHIIHPSNNIPTPDDYYPHLCRAFDRIEIIFKAKIIISCHPRANRALLDDYYNGREVVIGETNDVVRKSLFCIAHYSMSISYAVLYKKPIIFITTNSIEKSELGYKIIKCASYFKQRVINISKNFSLDIKKDLYFDDDIYKQYMTDYIKSKNSSDEKYWNVVSDIIKAI